MEKWRRDEDKNTQNIDMYLVKMKFSISKDLNAI